MGDFRAIFYSLKQNFYIFKQNHTTYILQKLYFYFYFYFLFFVCIFLLILQKKIKQNYIIEQKKIQMQFQLTKQDYFTINPQKTGFLTKSRLSKSPQSIGKILSKKLESKIKINDNEQNENKQRTKFSGDSSEFKDKQPFNLPFSPPDQLYLQNIKKQHQSSYLTQKSSPKIYRINKIYSSQISSKTPKRQKTPQMVGKLSSSRVNIQQVNENLETNKSTTKQQQRENLSINNLSNSKIKSPGKIISKTELLNVNSINSMDLMHKERDNKSIFSVGKAESYFGQLDYENKELLTQVKQKQQYLKKLIEKHRNEIKFTQKFLPRKKVHQISQNHKYKSPLALNGNNQKKISEFQNKIKSNLYRSNISKKLPNPYLQKNSYLQKIQNNLKGFRSFVSAPKYTEYQRNKSLLFQNTPKNNQKKTRKIIGEQKVLQKSRALQMRINPEINISFTVKSPRKDGKQSRVSHREVEQLEVFRRSINQSQQIPAVRVSEYSVQKNKNMNNRKPKFVDCLIDPTSQQYGIKKQQELNNLNLSNYANYFSRREHNLFKVSQTQESLNEMQNQFLHQKVTLKTKISQIKQILIQSQQKLHLDFYLPSCLFNSSNIQPNTQIQELHWLMQKVFLQMHLKPQIATIKQYKNAIFMGIRSQAANAKDQAISGLNKSKEQFNRFLSIIYHFGGRQIYVGDWRQNSEIKQSSLNKDVNNNVVSGHIQGIGLQILCKKIEQNIQGQNSKNILIQFEIYYGQYENNLKSGYGILLQLTFNQSQQNQQPISKLLEIGCWKDNKKHGWVKTYQNNILVQNAEYDHNVLIKKRNTVNKINN